MAEPLTPVPTALLAALAGMAADAFLAETWAGLTCHEAETIAAIVREYNPAAAEELIALHGTADDEEDDAHHDIYLADRADIARIEEDRTAGA